MSETTRIQFFATIAGSLATELGITLRLWDLEHHAAILMINPSVGDEFADESTRDGVTVSMHSVAFHSGNVVRLTMGDPIRAIIDDGNYELELVDIAENIPDVFTSPVCTVRLTKE